MTTGLIIGKFLPPHRGHAFLIETALARGRPPDRAGVQPEARGDPGRAARGVAARDVPGAGRAPPRRREPVRASRASPLLGAVDRQHPSGWSRPRPTSSSAPRTTATSWRAGSGRGTCSSTASGAPCPSRAALRADPIGCWDFLPECVRPAYVRRVVVTGPESTGKTTLARRLAEHFATAWAPEYARALPRPEVRRRDDPLAALRGEPTFRRSRGASSRARSARRAFRTACSSATPTSTPRASTPRSTSGRARSGSATPRRARRYELHLLLDVDVPWVADPQRDRPHLRRELLARLTRALENDRRPYVLVSGGWDERFERARAAVAERPSRSARSPRSEP